MVGELRPCEEKGRERERERECVCVCVFLCVKYIYIYIRKSGATRRWIMMDFSHSLITFALLFLQANLSKVDVTSQIHIRVHKVSLQCVARGNAGEA